MISSFRQAVVLAIASVVIGVATPALGSEWLISTTAGSAGIESTGWAGFFADDDASIHEADIDGLAAAGATMGCNPPSDTRYCPGRPVTRGEIAAFIRRTLALPVGQADYFSDDETSIFEDDINAITAAGIGFGCGDGTYCANDPIERDEVAEMLVRSFAASDPPRYANKDRNFFIDDEGNRFEESINRLMAAGVTKGCNPPTNDRYCPDRSLTRAEMASFFVRAAQDLPAVRIGVPLDAALVPESVPSDLSPSLSAAGDDKPVVYASGCHVSHTETRAMSCEFGHEGGPTIMLVGDSHAAQWVPSLRQLAEARGWRLLTMTKSGCPYLEGVYWNKIDDEIYVECQEWNENATAEILRLHPDLVVTSSSVTNYPLDGSEVSGTEVGLKLIRDGLAARLRQLESGGISVAVIRDTPMPAKRVPSSLQELDDVLECSTGRSEALSTDVQREAVEIVGRGRYLDLTDYMCTDRICPAVVESLLVWRDNSHLTARYARALAPALGSRLGDIMSSP